MATIDSYVVDSKVDPVSRKARRRFVWQAAAASVGLAMLAGLAFSGQARTPWAAKFDARVAADSAPYPESRDDEKIAAFQQSVAMTHLTAVAAAPIEAPRPIAPAPKPPRLPKPAPALPKKTAFAPVPPPRPAGFEVVAIDRTAPPAPTIAPAPEAKTPVLMEIVHRFQHAPDRAVEFATGVTAHLLSLRTRVGL